MSLAATPPLEVTILTFPEVAELLRCSQSTIRRPMRDNGLPFVQIKPWHRVTFDKHAVLRWWNEHRAPVSAARKVKDIRGLRRRHRA